MPATGTKTTLRCHVFQLIRALHQLPTKDHPHIFRPRVTELDHVTNIFFCGVTDTLCWISAQDFKVRVNSITCMLHRLSAMNLSESPLVRHLPTFVLFSVKSFAISEKITT